MKFGVSVEAPILWPELLALAREIDTRTRFEFLWIADSMEANGPEDAPRLEAWTLLAAIAHATSRVRLGALVSGNAYRHPALLAKMATTLDHISGGRLELGLGAGWPGGNPRYGIEFWRRPERIARLDEALQVIRALWTTPRPKLEGRYYRLDQPPYSPPNVQRPHPPITVGGGSDAVLRAVARHADAVNPMIDYAEARAKVAGFCAELGRDPASLRWSQEIHFFMNDDPAVQARALEWASAQQGQTEEQVRRTTLFGSLHDVREGVKRQRDQGVDELYLFQLPRVHLASLRRFSDEVIPAFA